MSGTVWKKIGEIIIDLTVVAIVVAASALAEQLAGAISTLRTKGDIDDGETP